MKKVILHVGVPKTGTTYIQNTLARNRSELNSAGVAYHQIPGSLSACHWWFALPFFDHIADYAPARIDFANSITEEALVTRGEKSRLNFTNELSGFDIVVISAEQFFFLPEQVLVRMADYFREIGASVQVVVYVRSFLDYAISEVNQKVKMGMARLNSFESFLPSCETGKNIEKFAGVFGRNSILVRNYSELSGKNIDLIDDFTGNFLPCLPAGKLKKERSVNSSLSYEGLLIMDEYNVLFPDDPPHSKQRDFLLEAVSRVAGRKYVASTAAVATLESRVAADCEYLESVWGIKFGDWAESSMENHSPGRADEAFRSVAHVLKMLLGKCKF